jgi:hypothetical protein
MSNKYIPLCAGDIIFNFEYTDSFNYEDMAFCMSDILGLHGRDELTADDIKQYIQSRI